MNSWYSTAPRPPAGADEVPRRMRDITTTGARYGAHRQSGVTLIELMVVIAVVAVLAIIAVPSYQRYAMRAHRTEAKAALMKLQTNEERYYLQNHQYTLTPSDLGFANNESENGVYSIKITSPSGVTQDYQATASPTAGGGINGVQMGQDTDCKTFTINSKGVRTASPDPNGDCW